MEITSNIFQVGGSEESHPQDAAVYLIAGMGEAALIDAGTGSGHAEIMSNIQRTGTSPKSIKYLFLTHCHYDHTGGAAKIKETTGCRIIAHKLDASYIEEGDNEVTGATWYGSALKGVNIDVKLEDRESRFKIGDLEIIYYHTPGHSPGSSVLTTISDGKLVLFGQDVHGPLNDSLLSDRGDYIKSLEFMISLEADILCEGHFGIYYGKDAVRDFIESYL